MSVLTRTQSDVQAAASDSSHAEALTARSVDLEALRHNVEQLTQALGRSEAMAAEFQELSKHYCLVRPPCINQYSSEFFRGSCDRYWVSRLLGQSGVPQMEQSLMFTVYLFSSTATNSAFALSVAL